LAILWEFRFIAVQKEITVQHSMNLGFFIQPVHPPNRPYPDTLREDREAVILADRLGYREAFIGEHLVDVAETITSSLMFIANLADACPSITFGTGVLPLANYHPAMAAAQVAMVDHLLNGRLILGVGPGVPPDAEAIGDSGTDRKAKTKETLEHMIRIWAEEAPYRIEGEFSNTITEGSYNPEIGVGEAIKPLQKPYPPIAITSMQPNAPGATAAGANGWTGISATYVGKHVVRSHIQKFLEGRESAGLSTDPSGWRVARSIFVADDEATAREYAHREDGAHGFYFDVMRTKLAKGGAQALMLDDPNQPESELTTKRCLERIVIAGTPESVADQIRAFREEVGDFGTLLYTGHDWTDPVLSRRSMELMTTEVLPRLTP
jgi:alkanesulfonate monooxygenase SsuD/methylene tetrahydromethanopterin reductase-like flavin-dependent oxidoreductase (luciferase family)